MKNSGDAILCNWFLFVHGQNFLVKSALLGLDWVNKIEHGIEYHCQNSSPFDDYLTPNHKSRWCLPLFSCFQAVELSREFPDIALEQISIDAFSS